MSLAFVALGSNLADPVQQVKAAFVALERIPASRVVKKSSLYCTRPVGYNAAQMAQIPDFINAIAEIETSLSPHELLDALLAIENNAGRERPYPNAPRVLDCDLLLYDDVELHSEKLTLPHPRMYDRGFVLLPLFEIAPHLSLPKHGKISALINHDMIADVTKVPT